MEKEAVLPLLGALGRAGMVGFRAGQGAMAASRGATTAARLSQAARAGTNAAGTFARRAAPKVTQATRTVAPTARRGLGQAAKQPGMLRSAATAARNYAGGTQLGQQAMGQAARFFGTPAGAYARSLGRSGLNAGRTAGKYFNPMGALEGGWTGSGADTAFGFMTGNDTNMGSIAGTLLGGFAPGLSRSFGRVSRGNPALASMRRRSRRLWRGNPNQSGMLAQQGPRRLLNYAAGYGLLGDVQEQLTAGKTPGGINFTAPAQSAARAKAVAEHQMAQEMGLGSAEELRSVLAGWRQMLHGQA